MPLFLDYIILRIYVAIGLGLDYCLAYLINFMNIIALFLCFAAVDVATCISTIQLIACHDH